LEPRLLNHPSANSLYAFLGDIDDAGSKVTRHPARYQCGANVVAEVSAEAVLDHDLGTRRDNIGNLFGLGVDW